MEDSVKTIGNGAFSYCTSLTTAILPHSLTSIGKSAFAFCSNLEKILIPKSVVDIDVHAFAGCKKLSIFTDCAQKPKGWKKTLLGSWNPDDRTVHWSMPFST